MVAQKQFTALEWAICSCEFKPMSRRKPNQLWRLFLCPCLCLCVWSPVFVLPVPARDRMRHGLTLKMPNYPSQSLRNIQRQAALGLLPQAMASVEDGLKQNSRDPQLLFFRAQLREANDDLEGAEADYRAAWLTNKLEPDETMHAAWELNHFGGLKTCLDICNQMVKSKNIETSARAYFIRGRVRSDLKRYPDAIKDYQESLRLSPDRMSANMELGRLELNAGQYQAAVYSYTRAIDLATVKEQQRVADSLRRRGEAYCKLGKNKEAIDDLTKAIKLSPMQSELLTVRAEMYKSMKENDKAEADLKNAKAVQKSIDF